MTAREPSRSTGRPKLLQPSPIAETRRPDLPTFLSCMEFLLAAAGKQRVEAGYDFRRRRPHPLGELCDGVGTDPGHLDLLLVGLRLERRILEDRGVSIAQRLEARRRDTRRQHIG